MISTKALTVVNALKDNYITIGPDVWRENQEHPEFEEDPSLFADWKEHAARDGIRVRIGRWKIAGKPIAVVLDFTTFFNQKDEIFKGLWEPISWIHSAGSGTISNLHCLGMPPEKPLRVFQGSMNWRTRRL